MKRTPRNSAARPAPARKTRKRSSPPRPVAAARGLRILRVRSVMDKSGLSRSQVYRKFGHLRIQLGPNSAGWIEAEIESEIKKLIAASRGGAEAAEKTGI